MGEGIVEIKEAMREASIGVAELLIDVDVDALKKEHQGLYNLFGDPATRLRYADGATVTAQKQGAQVAVDVQAPGVADGAKVVVTLETSRTVVAHGVATRADLDRMPPDAALARIADDNRIANDKVLARAEAALAGGRAHATLPAPAAAGDYFVKALAEGGAGAAAGHATLHVAPPP
jgi:hypothetical protein